MFGMFIYFGCHAKHEQINESPSPDDAYLKKTDELYDKYLNGDRNQAKQSLEDLINITETAKLTPFGHANMLFRVYSRLYAFEKRTGNQKLADAAFVKVRYWLLQQHKSIGQSDSQAAKEVEQYTPEQCLAEVDEWDKAHHNGVPPGYLAH